MSIKVEGYQDINNTLVSLLNLNDKLIPFQRRKNDLMTEKFKDYPPQLPGQRYVRTGQLGRSHQNSLTTTSDGFVSDLYSVGAFKRGKSYEQWVQVAATQARIHQGRWNNTDEAVLAENTVPIIDGYLAVIDEVLR